MNRLQHYHCCNGMLIFFILVFKCVANSQACQADYMACNKIFKKENVKCYIELNITGIHISYLCFCYVDNIVRNHLLNVYSRFD